MRKAGPLSWLGRGREAHIFELCDAHLKGVLATVKGMNRTVIALCELDSKGVEAGFQDAFKSERDADRSKREILEELSRGIFHPISRDELIRFVMTADEAAANAKAAAGKLKFIEPRKLHKELRETLKAFSSDLVEISDRLYKTFIALRKEPKSAVELSHKVEELEEKIDDFRREKLFPKLLEWHEALKNIGQSLLLEKILDNMENVADLCEDASDIIRCIAVSK